MPDPVRSRSSLRGHRAGSPRAVAASFRTALATLERDPAPELGRGFERWRMIGAGRDTVTGLWRAAAVPRPRWVIVLLGGIGTDDRAALLVPDSLAAGVLAVSWPWEGPRAMRRLEFLARVPALRAALLRTPAAIARGADAARQASPGSRVALVGASLGVSPTVAALPLAHPDALVIVDGAADLELLLRSEIARELDRAPWAGAVATPAAALGARLLSPLEPARYRSAAGATPVLIVDAEEEERYPAPCVARLHATFPHATRTRHPGRHMRPEDREQIHAIIEVAWSWLDRLEAPGIAQNQSVW